jgi:ribosomal-protein-alanine N-acetyltransferase
MPVRLETARLVIREYTLGDVDVLAEVFADPKVLWWEPAPWTRDQTAAYVGQAIARYRDDGIGEYAVVRRSDGRLIGNCGPAMRDIGGRRLPELGWDLRSDEWGKGYATEAARAVLEYAAAELGLSRLYSLILPENERSRGVATRLGMTLERRLVWHGRPHDLWVIELS